MLIKKAPDIRSSEITPKSVYLKRREFIQASAAALVAAGCRLACADDALAQGGAAQAAQRQEEPAQHHRSAERLRGRHQLQQLLRVRARRRRRAEEELGQVQGRRRGRSRSTGSCNKPAKYNLEDFIKPFALEERIYRFRCVEAWSFVIPWVGIPLSEFIKRAEPQGKAKFVEFTTLARRRAFPMQRHRRAASGRTRRRAAARRGDAPAGDSGRRSLRRGAAGAERRADPAGGAVEVRLQEHQVDRQDAVRREAAAQHVAGDGAQRVRLLRQREPDGRSSALEPGAREAAAELHRQPPHGDVQRLRRPGGRASTPAWTSAGTSEAAVARPTGSRPE